MNSEMVAVMRADLEVLLDRTGRGDGSIELTAAVDPTGRAYGHLCRHAGADTYLG